MDEEMYLTDLIEVDILQKIQDSFSEMSGMAAVITDDCGISVTNGSNFTDFCASLTRISSEGRSRCENCDKCGAEMAMQNGKACPYFCHAGLIEFAAPITANGRMVGSFVGGQVLSEAPDLDKFSETAVELGIDPEDYTHAVKKVKILSQEQIDKAAKVLNTMAEILSTIAGNSYNMHVNNAEIEKSAKLKSDFLANMSHEIRTPMNAVLGMAEMALRKEMTPTARDYLHQIRASGKNLLTIINDILDFSKIESGKMEIIEVPYEPLSMINDISSMINSRIGDKNIEFTVDAPPDIPHKLFGDNIRIQQIIINLLTNAIKFTKQGQVQLKLKCKKKDDDNIILKVLVSDTGSGIKEENLGKIFESFQQVDSKRNRNIEGTGLGLAITQQLLALMGGFIDVESEYNVGSVFAIFIPQKIVSHESSVPKADKPLSAAVIVQNMYVCAQLVKDLSRLNTTYLVMQKENYVDALDFDFLFVEENLFTKEMQEFVTQNPKLQCIVIENRKSLKRFNVVNIRTIRKPIYVLSLYSIMGIGEDYAAFSDFEGDDFPFTAPDANILIVDDNTINLTVAEGLLEPLNMKIDTATGAKDAINKIKSNNYDLIFMDHMMPEIDGIEATHMIRTTFPDYEDTPIIALTANAVANAKEMFLSEGMNDFVAKPIEIKDIVSKLKKWLPHEKIIAVESQTDEVTEDIPINGPFFKEVEVEDVNYQPVDEPDITPEEPVKQPEINHSVIYNSIPHPSELNSASSHVESAPAPAPAPAAKKGPLEIEGLNVKLALSLLGTEKLFMTVLKQYFCSIEQKARSIENHYNNEDWKNYTIEVHALKSTSKQIGAEHVSAVAAEMERASNEGNIELIRQQTAPMLEEYRSYKASLRYLFPDVPNDDEEKEADFSQIAEMLDKLSEAIENFDSLQMDEIVDELGKYKLSGDHEKYFTDLKEAVSSSDLDTCSSVIASWKTILN